MTRPGLLVEDLQVERGRFALGPITFEASPGEILWISGPNGAGKSTLIAAIAGLLPVVSGRVIFDGRVLSAAGRGVPPWERPCGLLLQDPGLWPHLTLRSQCLLVAGDRGSAREAPERLEGLAARLLLGHLLDRRPPSLSGGEAERGGLLRALMADRPLLLVDEPYGEQHPDGVACIDRLLGEIAGAGKTVVIAGHRAPPGTRRLEVGGDPRSREG